MVVSTLDSECKTKTTENGTSSSTGENFDWWAACGKTNIDVEPVDSSFAGSFLGSP